MGLDVLCNCPSTNAGVNPPSTLVVETEEIDEETTFKTLQAYTATRSSRADLVTASFTTTYKASLRHALQKSELNFVLTDPRLQDNPIVYASYGFLKMTEYIAEEVLGRNCRFLQGPATNRRTITEIRDAIREERACQVAIVNYTKHGKPFWNLFHMAPVYSRDDGRVVHFLGVQIPINSSSADAQLPQDMECFCPITPASVAHDDHVSATKSSVAADMDEETFFSENTDEETCEVGQADKDKAKSVVNSLLNELARKCKGAGVTGSRCTAVAAGSGGQRVICSSLMLSLTKVQQSFVLANPHLPDTPIVHASEMFLQLTGYTREEVVGRNCKFLQGPDTDPRAVLLIRESLKAEKPCTVRLLNYRKDKTSFWNLLHIAPVRNNTGKVAFYVGVQLDEASPGEERSPGNGMTPNIKQLGAVGAVRVAVRSLQGEGLRRIRING